MASRMDTETALNKEHALREVRRASTYVLNLVVAGIILAAGAVPQIVEDRVIEDLPPLTQVLPRLADPFIGRVDPVSGDRGGRLLVVRPDLEAVVDVVTDSGAAGAR